MDLIQFFGRMHIFRYAGDLSHCCAILLLLFKLLHTKSCAGFSRRTQLLMAILFSTRYTDLFFLYISAYNSLMKLLFLATSYGTLFLMYYKFRETHDSKNDTFRIEFLILTAGLLAYFINDEFTVIEVLWAFSIYLEAVAILPQLVISWKIGKIEKIVCFYLLAFGSYRAFYLLDWVYRFVYDGKYNLIAIYSGVVQTCLFCGFFVLWKTCRRNETSDDVESRDCVKDGDIFIVNGFLDHVPAEKDGVIKA